MYIAAYRKHVILKQRRAAGNVNIYQATGCAPHSVGIVGPEIDRLITMHFVLGNYLIVTINVVLLVINSSVAWACGQHSDSLFRSTYIRVHHDHCTYGPCSTLTL